MADKLGLDFALIHRKRKSRYRDQGSRDSQSQSRSGSTNQSRRQSPDFRIQLSSLQMNGIEPDAPVRGEPSDEDGMELLVGNVKDKTVVLVDDMIDTGVTVSLATRLLKDAGAARIFLLASHGLFADTNIPYLMSLPIERLVVTNTIPQLANQAASDNKLVILDVSAILSESIRRSHNGESFGILFGEGGPMENRT